MSRRIRRNEGGQFAQGQSGNPDGARLRRPKELLTETDLHRIVLEVAGETAGQLAGRPVSRYEHAIRSLVRGDASNRLAAKDFDGLTKSAAYHFAALEREAARRQRGS